MKPLLPDGVTVFERGWLSANNILLVDKQNTTLIDSGYVTHQSQTLLLIKQALKGRPLDQLINTHLHSDHCGGNHALQSSYPALRTLIPPGASREVADWDETALTYQPTGQNCPRFSFTETLEPGSHHQWANLDWDVHAAPGHDPDSVILFAPEVRLLISADALWQNGFGVVFPELSGIAAFDEVKETLDLIESLAPLTIIPGHGQVFTNLEEALTVSRRRLESFSKYPERHAMYGAKVLLKFKMLEWGQITKQELQEWTEQVPYLQKIHQKFGENSMSSWLEATMAELIRNGAIDYKEGVFIDL